jgi:bifunctional DNA-binding transcriptional regulator/antitoxin component of YhaV-PrlF toxin-antitoxin module
MAVDRWQDEWDDDPAVRTYQAKVTGRHAVTLPAELCRVLGIEVGDTVQFTLQYGTVTMHLASEPPPPQARGILAGHFETIEDVNRFIREERDWDEHEAAWTTSPSPRGDSSMS